MNEIVTLRAAWAALPHRIAVIGALSLLGASVITGVQLSWPASQIPHPVHFAAPLLPSVPPNPIAPGEGAPVAQSPSVAAPAPSLVSTAGVRGSDILDKSKKKVGVLADVLVGGGQATAVVRLIPVAGEERKDVAVPLSDLRFESDRSKKWAVLNASGEAIKNLPALQPGSMDVQ